MKKLILVLILIQSGFLVAQTKAVVTINGEKVQVNPNAVNTADNGLIYTAGNVQLGGKLLKPTTITTTTNGTLSIGGLEAGSGTDNVLVAGLDGILKWVTRASFVQAGDDLGNHTATEDLKMSSKSISGAANITASGTVDAANTTVSIKTTTQTAAITKGMDGAAPGAGYVPTAADVFGNINWTAPSTIVSKPDNLGNHTATTTLNMAKNSLNNVNVAYFADQIESNTNKYGIYKNNGVLRFWSDKSNADDFAIDESTRKTSVNNIAIMRNADATTPVPNTVATSFDDSGAVIWKSLSSAMAVNQVQADWNMTTTTNLAYVKNKPSFSIIDNLGNHVAGQDLNMSNKNIIAATNITATGKTIIGASTATNVLQIKAASDPLTIGGLTVSTDIANVGLVVDASGVLKKGEKPAATRVTYVTPSLNPGQSYTATLTINPQAKFFMITTGNDCGKSAIATFVNLNNVLAYLGGQARNMKYTATPTTADGDFFTMRSFISGCQDGGSTMQFDFDLQKTDTAIIITNRGNINRKYVIRQSEF